MTRRMMRLSSLLAPSLLLFAAGNAAAQTSQSQSLTTPMASPYAEVSQRIGLTDIKVTYHRPAVGGREVWKTVVPSDGLPVWRTGANENTTVSFSTDVTVQGESLAAGTYGLHSIPGEDAWTMVFSNDSQGWGSYAYDPEHDALRVQVTPGTAPSKEHFEFSFDNLQPGAVDLVLRWAEVRVPVTVAIDLHDTVLANYKQQLTGLTQFFWQGWDQAAQYALTNDVALEEAIGWADRSIQAEERFNNLQTKAGLLRKLDRTEEADKVMARAVEIANPRQSYGYGRQLQAQGEVDKAMAIYRETAKNNPDSWIAKIGLARVQSADGDFAAAAKSMSTAIEGAPAAFRGQLGGLLEQLEAGKDIN